MYVGKKIIGIIPARGGSKGLPKKNILPLAGKPLISWTIEEAKKSKYIDRLILSSDDDEIIFTAKKWGCEVPFKRPPELAQDNVVAVDVIIHALKFLQERYDFVVLLQPTSPLRKVDDIDGCIAQCISRKTDSCVSLTKPEKSPYWMYRLDKGGKMVPLINMERSISRRQDLPDVYATNGAVYIVRTDVMLDSKSFVTDNTIAYIMPRERSVDIDDIIDFKIAEMLLKEDILDV